MCTELTLYNVAFFDVRRLLQNCEIQKGVEYKLKNWGGGSDSSWGEWMTIALKKCKEQLALKPHLAYMELLMDWTLLRPMAF